MINQCLPLSLPIYQPIYLYKYLSPSLSPSTSLPSFPFHAHLSLRPTLIITRVREKKNVEQKFPILISMQSPYSRAPGGDYCIVKWGGVRVRRCLAWKWVGWGVKWGGLGWKEEHDGVWGLKEGPNGKETVEGKGGGFMDEAPDGVVDQCCLIPGAIHFSFRFWLEF